MLKQLLNVYDHYSINNVTYTPLDISQLHSQQLYKHVMAGFSNKVLLQCQTYCCRPWNMYVPLANVKVSEQRSLQQTVIFKESHLEAEAQ